MHKSGLILAFALFSAAFNGCAGPGGGNNVDGANANTANASANSIHGSAEQLGMLIKLPFEAEEVAWKEQPLGQADSNSGVPAPNERKLVAVFRFSDEDSAKLVSSLTTRAKPEPVSLSPEEWYPAELLAQSEFNGEAGLRGESYPADDFYQSPYLNGKIARVVDTNYFVLELISR